MARLVEPVPAMIEVRRATADDLDVLLPLVGAYRSFYKQTIDPERERAFVRDRLESGTGVVFLAFGASDACGFMQLFQTYSTVHLGASLLLEDIFVVPHARRNGVATHLLVAAMEYAHQIDATGMFLETARDNATAQLVYERAGWTREGHFVKYNAPL